MKVSVHFHAFDPIAWLYVADRALPKCEDGCNSLGRRNSDDTARLEASIAGAQAAFRVTDAEDGVLLVDAPKFYFRCVRNPRLRRTRALSEACA